MVKPLLLACITVVLANVVSLLLTSGSDDSEPPLTAEGNSSEAASSSSESMISQSRPVSIYSEQKAYDACQSALDDRYGSKLKARHLNSLSSGLDEASGDFLIVVEGLLGLSHDAKPLRAYCYVNPRDYSVSLTVR